MPQLNLVDASTPLDQGAKLVPWDQREGLENLVPSGHLREGQYETLWEPTVPQTRIPSSQQAEPQLALPVATRKRVR